jgi:hypothetical protein
MTRYVYAFAEGGRDMADVLDGKGANLAEMTRPGLPEQPCRVSSIARCPRPRQRPNGPHLPPRRWVRPERAGGGTGRQDPLRHPCGSGGGEG